MSDIGYFNTPFLLSCYNHVNYLFNYFNNNKFVDQICKILDDILCSILQNCYSTVDLVELDPKTETVVEIDGDKFYKYKAECKIFFGLYRSNYKIVSIQLVDGSRLFISKDFLVNGDGKIFEILLRYPIQSYSFNVRSIKSDKGQIRDYFNAVGYFVLVQKLGQYQDINKHLLLPSRYPNGTEVQLRKVISEIFGLFVPDRQGLVVDKKQIGGNIWQVSLDNGCIGLTVPNDSCNNLQIGSVVKSYQYVGDGFEIFEINRENVRDVTVPARWFHPNLNGFLTWYNQDQPTFADIDPVSNKTRFRWGLGAVNSLLVNSFWEIVMERSTQPWSKTLAQLITGDLTTDPSPGSLPFTINPAKILFEYILPKLAYILIIKEPFYSRYNNATYDLVSSKIREILPNYCTYHIYLNDYQLLPLQNPTS